MPPGDAKPVKEEVEEDEEDNKPIGNKLKKKANNASLKELKAKKPQSKVKKEEPIDHFDEPIDHFDEPISKKISTKTDKVQKKKKKEEGLKKKKKKKVDKEAEQTGKKRERKVYDLPGQKRDPPEEREPLRIFYQTLYKQVPGSEMAAIWLMESGLLPKEEARKVFERKQKAQQQLSSPMKSVVTVKRTEGSVTIKKKTSSAPASTQIKKTPDSKVAPNQSKKRKNYDDFEGESDSDFVSSARKTKKQRAA